MNPGSLEEGLAAAWHVALASGEEVRFPLFSDTEIQLPITDDDSSRLALGPVANFCGAYVDNAFSERQETWIELHQSGLSSQSPIRFTSTETLQERKPLPALAKRSEREWWFETNLKIPFLHSLGFDASFDEHTILVFPLLRQKQIKTLNGWINGAALNIQRYIYPLNHDLACHYADLNGTGAHGGENTLVVHLAY